MIFFKSILLDTVILYLFVFNKVCCNFLKILSSDFLKIAYVSAFLRYVIFFKVFSFGNESILGNKFSFDDSFALLHRFCYPFT